MEIKTGSYKTLSQVADDVKHGDDVKELVSEMWKAMVKSKGCGLAANQVGVLKRVIVVHTNGF